MVIVGAGVTGALVAEATTAAGLSTIVIDRRLPARGSTAASTALLQFEIDTPLIHLADQIGFSDAARAWRRSYGAVQDLASIVGRLSIDCGFRNQRALYLSSNVLDASELPAASPCPWRGPPRSSSVARSPPRRHQPTVLVLPSVERSLADPRLPAHLLNRGAVLSLAKHDAICACENFDRFIGLPSS